MSVTSPLTAVKVYKTSVWIESDIVGARHVVLQHETAKPFTYCTIHYGYGYNDNASTLALAEAVARMLGATDPIEHRLRALEEATQEEIRAEIESLKKLLDTGGAA